MPECPCPNHKNVRVPRAYGHQSIHDATIIAFVFLEHMITNIHAQTIVAFVFLEETVTKASMPKPY